MEPSMSTTRTSSSVRVATVRAPAGGPMRSWLRTVEADSLTVTDTAKPPPSQEQRRRLRAAQAEECLRRATPTRLDHWIEREGPDIGRSFYRTSDLVERIMEDGLGPVSVTGLALAVQARGWTRGVLAMGPANGTQFWLCPAARRFVDSECSTVFTFR
jgi:hypothetical protein